jgi:cytochrome c peroxidase
MFTAVFGEEPRMLNISMALAAYERTVISGDSRFDRYAKGDKGALTKEEKQGLVLFVGKARCARCHSGPNFTDNNFHSIGINNGDDGRFLVSHAEDDRAAFKTPGLRNVAMHPPYMHDGSLSSLADVIDYYDRGGNAGKTKSPFIYRIGLTPSEKRELLEFLRALSGENGQQKQ